MRNLTRRILVGTAILVNATMASNTAQAAQDLNVDNIGGIIVVWCDGCWIYNCNCPASEII